MIGAKQNPTRSDAPSQEGTKFASRAALLLGGWWTLGNKTDARAAIWLARISSLLMVPLLFFVLLRWYAFFFANRHNLSERELESGVVLLALSSIFAILAALPLSRRVAHTWAHRDDAAQRRQIRFGAGIHLFALTLLLSYWATNQAIADAIREARGRAGAAKEENQLSQELDKLPLGPTGGR